MHETYTPNHVFRHSVIAILSIDNSLILSLALGTFYISSSLVATFLFCSRTLWNIAGYFRLLFYHILLFSVNFPFRFFYWLKILFVILLSNLYHRNFQKISHTHLFYITMPLKHLYKSFSFFTIPWSIQFLP